MTTITAEYTDQLDDIITKFVATKKYIPFFDDLEQHPLYGGLFADMNDVERRYTNDRITHAIQDNLTTYKTKSGQLFRRIYENEPELFWAFRAINNTKANIETDEFRTLGAQIAALVYKYEGVLTEPMLNREMWLDKTLSAYYDVVHTFFPLYGFVDAD